MTAATRGVRSPFSPLPAAKARARLEGIYHDSSNKGGQVTFLSLARKRLRPLTCRHHPHLASPCAFAALGDKGYIGGQDGFTGTSGSTDDDGLVGVDPF